MDLIQKTFAKCKEQKRAALVAYITAGFPTIEDTVDILLGLENGGAGKLCKFRIFFFFLPPCNLPRTSTRPSPVSTDNTNAMA